MTTHPPDLLPLLRLHAWLHTDGLADGVDGVDEEAWQHGERGLAHPLGVLELARSLLEDGMVVEDTLGPWRAEGPPLAPGTATDASTPLDGHRPHRPRPDRLGRVQKPHRQSD